MCLFILRRGRLRPHWGFPDEFSRNSTHEPGYPVLRGPARQKSGDGGHRRGAVRVCGRPSSGNLQIYAGDHQRINHYAAFLHSPANAAPLWIIRAFLASCVVLHVIAAMQLWWQNRQARPVGYKKKDDLPAAYAARTMIWSGPIIGAFVIFHVLHLTAGAVLPLRT